MKKYFLLIAVIAIAFTACQSSPSPSKVAEQFAKSMINNDFATAEKLATKDSRPILKENEVMSKENPLPDSTKKALAKSEVKILSEKIENDTVAAVTLKTILSKEIMNRRETTETLMLKKEEGTWRIDIMGTMKRIMMDGANMPTTGQDAALDSTSH